jgi:dolichol-phosphate mannosyltransferase
VTQQQPGAELLVVVPTFNEADNVAPLIQAIEAARRESAFDVLVVDDSSPDGTAALVQQLQADRPWLHLLSRAAPTGLGSAYRAGFRWALERDYGFVGEMDADLSHDPAAIPALHRAAVEGADLAIGSRYVRGGATEGWPARRRLLSWGANAFARTALKLDVRDVTAGFRVYRQRAIRLLLAGAGQCEGYGFQVEGVCAIQRASMTVAEVPITFTERRAGASKLSRKTTVEAVRRVLALSLWDEVPPTLSREQAAPIPQPASRLGAV